MKKSMLLIAAFAFSASVAFAQDLTSKKGEAYLPAAGDWSIGIDATPVLNYVGGFLSSAGGVAPTWNYLNGNQAIIGKMYKDESHATRAILRIGINSMTQKEMIKDATVITSPTYPNLPAMVEDQMKSSSTYVGLGLGKEWRRGKTRLQGFYGVDAMIMMNSAKSTYTYGNKLSSLVGVDTLTTTNFGSNIGLTIEDSYGYAARITEMKSGNTIGIGVRGFVGCEYFILPKISIGAEFGWGFGFGIFGASSATMESVGTTGTIGVQTVEGSKASGLMLDTDTNGSGSSNASLRMNFHF